MLLAILSTLLISEVKSQVMPQITVPETFPSGNQNKMIDPAFVNSPYLAPFIEYVKAKVNPKYLAIPQSVYRPGSPSSPNYANNQEGPALENCYWPYNLCTRNTDTADFKADISKCPNDNDWGLTYDGSIALT